MTLIYCNNFDFNTIKLNFQNDSIFLIFSNSKNLILPFKTKLENLD